MKSEIMLDKIKGIFEKVQFMHIAGQKEYAHDEDNVFANFERIASQMKTDKKFILWVYFMKHVDGIASYINGHQSQREDVRGRLTDAIVYLIILWAMIDEDQNG